MGGGGGELETYQLLSTNKAAQRSPFLAVYEPGNGGLVLNSAWRSSISFSNWPPGKEKKCTVSWKKNGRSQQFWCLQSFKFKILHSRLRNRELQIKPFKTLTSKLKSSIVAPIKVVGRSWQNIDFILCDHNLDSHDRTVWHYEENFKLMLLTLRALRVIFRIIRVLFWETAWHTHWSGNHPWIILPALNTFLSSLCLKTVFF